MQTERADEMRGFRISGFNSEEVEHIQRSTEYLRLAVPAVLDALYDHLLSLPEKREFFERRTSNTANSLSSPGSPAP